MKRVAILMCLALGACGTTKAATQPLIVTKDVNKAVLVKCQPKVEKPDLPDTDEKLKNDVPFPGSQNKEQIYANLDARVGKMIAGRLMRDQYIGKLEAALSGCSR